jgi:hypothetical protein
VAWQRHRGIYDLHGQLEGSSLFEREDRRDFAIGTSLHPCAESPVVVSRTWQGNCLRINPAHEHNC